MTLSSCLLGLALFAALARAEPAEQQSAALAAYQRADRFRAARLNELVYKTKVAAHWVADTDSFWYRNIVRGESEFVLVEADKGVRRLAFDHDRLAKALSAASGATVAPSRLPFQSATFAPSLKTVDFQALGSHWRCDLTTYACTQAEGPPAWPKEEDQQPPAPKKPENSRKSPDGKWLVLLKENNVFLRRAGGDQEIRLTSDGDEQDRYGSFRGWSPDSRWFVVCRTTPGEDLQMHVVEAHPKDSLRPKLHSYTYPLPGDRVAVYRLWLFDAQTRTGAAVDTEPVDWWGPPNIRWQADSRSFTYEQTFRGFQRCRVVEVSVETGKARTIIDERSDTFLPPMKHFSHYLDDSREILWMSERDGWNHLYLFDGKTGALKTQVTRGEWVVRGVERVDEEKRQVWFTGSGREPGQNPYHVHHYRVNLDGSGLVCLTPGDGTHSLTYSPNGRYLLDEYSRVDAAPVTELRRAADGALVCQLERADVADLLDTGWRWPEPFCAKGRDGQTDIWGVLFRPSTLDESRKYPVIETIYAGPQGSSVPTTFALRRGQQVLAELGFIVVQLDGMGMSGRSKAFHDVAFHNLGDSGFPDRILWMQAAARKYPYLDLTRVGVTGVSAGGYNAAHALIAHPEFYKAAIAISGNHDHRTDKAWWNELWMGYPVGDHYREQSNIEHADKLQGKLFLIDGALDRNVNPFASGMQFVQALIDANKDFEMLLVPNAGHGGGGSPYVTRRQWDFWMRNLRGEEPPAGYTLKKPDDGSCHLLIKNLRHEPVAVYWRNFDGRLQKYYDLAPGAEKRQHTFYGHNWEAQVDGRTVSTFAAEPGRLQWQIGQ